MLPEVIKLVTNVYKVFQWEAKRRKPIYSWKNVFKRTKHALGISSWKLKRALDSYDKYGSDTSKEAGTVSKVRMTTIDSFDRSVVKRAAVTLLNENKNISMKVLRQYLQENHEMTVSKCIHDRRCHTFETVPVAEAARTVK